MRQAKKNKSLEGKSTSINGSQLVISGAWHVGNIATSETFSKASHSPRSLMELGQAGQVYGNSHKTLHVRGRSVSSSNNNRIMV